MLLAVRNGVPVVPVHIEGTRRILRRGAKTITPSTKLVISESPTKPKRFS